MIRSQCAHEWATTWKQTVVLKGRETLIAAPNEPTLFVETPPSLATAGSGDVLSGSIGALLAQGLAPRDAAALAVYVGNQAAARVSSRFGTLGLVASDLPAAVAEELACSKGRRAEVQQAKELTVRDVMRRQVPVASPTTAIAELARLMVEHRVPGVPILEDDQLVGIVTEGDLIQREASVDFPEVTTIFDAVFFADTGEPLEEELRHVLATTARDLMTAPVISIREYATLSELATLMVQRRINPIPVVDEERRIIGLATRSGLVEAIARLESTS